MDEFNDTINRCCESDEWLKEHRPQITIEQAGGAFDMDLSHPVVSTFKETFKSVMDREVDIVGSPAGVDSRTWLNIAECPTIQYGPGCINQCHAVDEYIEIEQYYKAILIYAQLILDWCSREDI